MIFYDLVNDGLHEEVEKFFNDPEEYGGGNTEDELDDHIKKAFAKQDPHETIEEGHESYVSAVPQGEGSTDNSKTAMTAPPQDKLLISFGHKFEGDFSL